MNDGNRWWIGGGLGVAVLVALALLASSCGGAGRNCLVIPAQIEMNQERREAALSSLENKARQVDRMRSSLQRAQERYDELQAERALLDSLGVD